MNLKDRIQQIVVESVKTAVKEGKISSEELPEPKIEYPREPRFGDYSTPFALECAKIIKRSPLETGNILKEYIEKNPVIQKVEVVKPGFINMFISPEYMISNISSVIEEGDNYGLNSEQKNIKINLEFVSANPTGPLNIVSARAAAIGDTLANLFEADGYTVDREFYVNDYGNQFMLLGKSVAARIEELKGNSVEFPDDGYHGEYIKDIAKYIIDNLSEKYESLINEEEKISFAAEKAVEYNVGSQKKDLEKFNVRFDRWFSERILHEKGKVEDTGKILDDYGYTFEEEGKKFFSSTKFGDDKDRVIIREDGRPTYLLADIAYHRDKIERGYDRIIDIWGPDHHGYIARLSGAVTALGYKPENFRILIAQQVNLLMDGETVKMSKRQGVFSTMSDLIEDIGVDVARYFFVMRSLESHLDFDLELAKRQSSENPVFYLQYAHARICSIFREAEKRGYSYDPGKTDAAYLDNTEAVNLMKLIVKYPEEISDAASAMEPHRITTFLMRLAQSYHKFYTEHRILSDDSPMRGTYLSLSDAVRTVMKNGLTLIGVSSPEQM